jgi:hypothetical protein
MTYPLEYHDVVNRSARRSIPASLAVLGSVLLLLIGGSFAQAGASGSSGSAHAGSVAPPTAFSAAPPTGFSVAPPTGSTAGHSGFATANSGGTLSTHTSSTRTPHTPHSPSGPNGNNNGHSQNHTANGVAYYPYIYALPVPYAVDVSDADTPNDDDAEYQGGPTIFDRRGSGADSYVPPSSDGAAEDAAVAQSDADPALEPPQPPTTLVFKDGHQLEVDNYAIVSQTLYDLTPGHPRKIALADLDLAATEKQNDANGVVFQLPPSAQAN